MVAQALGVLAILPYMGFVLTVDRNATASSGARHPPLLPAGALVSLATLGTTVPVLVLALLSHPSLSETRALARASEITDAVLFAVIAVFAVACRGRFSPRGSASSGQRCLGSRYVLAISVSMLARPGFLFARAPR